MMIKKFSNFILENLKEESQSSIGEYIESLAEKDQNVKRIVSDFTQDSSPWIKISNAINILPELEKSNLLKKVQNYLNREESKEVEVSTSVLLEESYGEGVLTTFFKCLTALGFKDNEQSLEVPSEFLVFFKFVNLDVLKVIEVFNRFKSLSSLELDVTLPNISLYLGLKNDLTFEYGYYYDELVTIGSFKLTKKSLNKLKLSDLKSTSGLKRVLMNLNFEDLKLLSKIKEGLVKFNPGYYEQKSSPVIIDRTIQFGYYGVGKWDNGVLDEGELMNIKSNLKSFLINFNWSEKVQISASANKFWIFLKIRLK